MLVNLKGCKFYFLGLFLFADFSCYFIQVRKSLVDIFVLEQNFADFFFLGAE